MLGTPMTPSWQALAPKPDCKHEAIPNPGVWAPAQRSVSSLHLCCLGASLHRPREQWAQTRCPHRDSKQTACPPLAAEGAREGLCEGRGTLHGMGGEAKQGPLFKPGLLILPLEHLYPQMTC